MLKFTAPHTLLPSVFSLIIANLIPLFGVVFYGWDISSIMFLYWAESAIIGGFTVLKILRSEASDNQTQAANTASKAFFLTFFPIHYGIFMSVHLVFILVLFGIFSEGFTFLNIFWSFLSLLASHTISYFTNYIGNKEYKKLSPDQLFMLPYPRIFVMHLTILLGSFFVIATGQSIIALALLVILKIIVDIASHLFEHSQSRT